MPTPGMVRLKRDDHYLAPKLLQLFGMALFLAASVFWAVTDRESVTVMSGALALIMVGAYQRAYLFLKNATDHDYQPVEIAERGGNGV